MNKYAWATLALVAVVPVSAQADVGEDRFDLGGYLRIMTRPDFQGGDSRLGFWNLYGRLLNEGPYAALDLRIDLLPREAGGDEPWTSAFMRLEGGSAPNADRALGRLDNFFLSQLYVQAGNVLLEDVTFQLGTLDSHLGELGLYDMRPAQIFFETLGLFAKYEGESIELLLGIGDAGYRLRREQYDTILTAGAWARFHPSDHFEVGVGAQGFFEPGVRGNRFAPHQTPGVEYEDFVRREVVAEFDMANPMRLDEFPRPDSTSASSFKAFSYIGFGDVGPLKWTSLFFTVEQRHPDNFYVESFMDRDFNIFVKELTDERYSLLFGTETQLQIVPEVFDVVIGGVLGHHFDEDNEITPTDFDRTYYSALVRMQVYVTETFHLLGETVIANEISSNGNAYRLHADSVFRNDGGIANTRGLEFGDSDSRTTWQGKIGVVLNPTGTGIFSRPSIRVMYGVQYSNQNNAFGNSFVETLDEFNEFGSPEQHWHHLVALEAEAWF
jgi:hypothetical protein